MGSRAHIDELKRDLAALRGEGGLHARADVGGHGRDAAGPTEIPSRGWRDVLLRSWREVSDANLFLVAGGVTYAILLALFPGLAALISLYGLMFDPAQVEKQIEVLSGVMPEQTQKLLSDELHSLVDASHTTLGISAVIALLIAVWSASRGMSGLISALDIAYEERETRSFVRFNMIALALTGCLIVGGIIVVTLVAVLPAAVQLLGLGSGTKWLLLIVQWPLLIVIVMLGLAVLYRYAPDREEPKWRWVSPGAIVATLLWIIASIAFTVYVANFNSYTKTYGSLGGVIILLTWLYLSALAVLLGAVINAQAEKQTTRDSTTGPPRAMGQRGAKATDTLGESKA